MARLRIGGTRGTYFTYKAGRSLQPSEIRFLLVLLVLIGIIVGILVSWEKMRIETKVFSVLFSTLIIFTCVLFERRKSQMRIRRLRALKLSNIDNMSGLQFEQYIAEILRYKGYKKSDSY